MDCVYISQMLWSVYTQSCVILGRVSVLSSMGYLSDIMMYVVVNLAVVMSTCTGIVNVIKKCQRE